MIKQGVIDNELAKLKTLLEHLSKMQFYGKVEITFEHGKPVIVRKTESIKLNS